MPLGFAPFSLFFVPILALAALFYLWRQVSPRRAAWRGFLFGAGMFGWGVSWVHISMNQFAGVDLVSAVSLTVLLVAYLSIYPAFLGWLMVRLFPDCNWVRLLLVSPAVWTLLEWARSWVLTGFPWLSLGYSQIDSPLAGLASFSGVYGVSWAAAFTSSLLVYAYLGGKQRALTRMLPALLALWTVSWGMSFIDWSRPFGKPLQVALIQGNVSQEFKWDAAYTEETLNRYLEMSRAHNDADLIVWPETAIPLFLHEAELVLEELDQERLYHGTEFLLGIREYDAVNRQFYNSVVSIAEKPRTYRKNHLVPFGEYVPLRALLGDVLRFLDMPQYEDFAAGGTEQKSIEIGKYLLGVSICYEDAFPKEVSRPMPYANFLVNVSNDAWFGDSIAAWQHLQIARMRALENGRYLLRATNTGVSAVIDAKGEIIAQAPQFALEAVRAKIQPMEGGTPYALSGNFQLFFLMFICLLVGIVLHYHWHPPTFPPPPPQGG